MVQAGDSKANCVYVGGSSVNPQLARAEEVTGVVWDCLETFSDQDKTWSNWVDPWITSPSSGIPQWLSRHPRRRTLIVSEDLIPQSATNGRDPLAWELPCARGEYDGYARQFARALVRAGEGDAVVRLGKEMNGEWEPDYMGKTPVEQRDWARCFAREVAAMRSVRGAHLLFDWNPNACTNDYPLSSFYPGNASVDIIGLDLYDADCMSPLTSSSPASWHKLYTEPLGLAAITRFARAHERPMSIPEWGLSTKSPGHGTDPYYVNGIGRYVATNEVAFQAYFDGDTSGIVPLSSSDPVVLRAYQRAFGGSGEVALSERALAK